MIFRILWLFIAYSFLGWIVETVMVVLHRQQLVNRGILAGPFCLRYGTFLVWVTLLGGEAKQNWAALIIGCMLLGGYLEWFTGKALERATGRKWWDYSGRRFNLDGRVCAGSALVNGVGGALCVKFINPLLWVFFGLFPAFLRNTALIVMSVLIAVDAIWCTCAILNVPQKLPKTESIHSRLILVTVRLSNWVVSKTIARLQKSYPLIDEEEETLVFARGCGFYKLFWLFLAGGFAGDLIETVFCRWSMGYWMSRSSLVWAPFSVVWALCIVIATELLHNYIHKSDAFLFLYGTLIGGVFEYVCSVFTQLVFGRIFWDYSHLPFNLFGRINLLFCFFWGIAAVIWLKVLYPRLSKLIERIPPLLGPIISWVLVIFMTVNMGVSGLALLRSASRKEGKKPATPIGVWLDEQFPDEKLAKIYPSSKDRSRTMVEEEVL